MTLAKSSIAAIPTTYAGIQFRSRLEARWAVFFDAIGTPWEYEPEAFYIPSFIPPDNFSETNREIAGKGYLPDFWLPEVGAYFEVKGASPSDDVWERLYQFERLTGKRVILAIGAHPSHALDNEDYYSPLHVNGDFPYEFCRCPACNKLGCEFDGRGGRVCKNLTTVPPCPYQDPLSDDKGYNITPEIGAAYAKARSFRLWNPA